MGLSNAVYRFLYCLAVAFSLFLARLSTIDQQMMVAMFAWLMIFSAEITYPNVRAIWRSPTFIGLLGFMIIPATCIGLFSFVWPMSHSMTLRYLLLYLLILVWGADTVAYFVGTRMGKRKLAPMLSPGKTVEGVVGAFVGCLIVAALGGSVFHVQGKDWINWLLFSVTAGMISVIGDLGISLLKRLQDVKDSGHLLPGHGGILDRIDGLLIVVPFFVLVFPRLNIWISLL